jgi:hypothetical protein
VILLSTLRLDRVAADRWAKDRRCGECGGVLTVAWGGAWGVNEYVIRCGNDMNHDTANKVDTTAEYLEYKSKLGWRDKRLAAQVGTSTEMALRQYEFTPALNRDQAREVALTLWPGAPEIEVKKVSMVCAQYGLNPLMKHVYLVGYNRKDRSGNVVGTDWSMVLGIKAKRIIAARAKPYSYVDGTPRIMTEAEQIAVFGEVDAANLVFITKLKDRDGNIYPGYGKYSRTDVPKGVEKGNSRANMGMIRSESNALDRLVPGEQMPHDIETVPDEIINQAAQERVTVRIEPPTGPERQVNPTTGEITEIEGEVVETTTEQAFDDLKSAGQPETPHTADKPQGAPETAPESKSDGLTGEQVETTVPPDLLADMAKVKYYEKTAIAYCRNVLKVVIPASDNFAQAWARMNEVQRNAFRAKIRELIEVS